MNQLLVATGIILDQLDQVVNQINEDDFRRPSAALSQATVGQHLRHTIEFFVCLERGFMTGLVNYDKRNHDHQIETDKSAAIAYLQRINAFITAHRDDRSLRLEMAYERGGENWITIETNYWRELVYNIEHAVHHMAIMKIGIREVAPYVELPSDFGVAVSTLRFKDTVPVSVE